MKKLIIAVVFAGAVALLPAGRAMMHHGSILGLVPGAHTVLAVDEPNGQNNNVDNGTV